MSDPARWQELSGWLDALLDLDADARDTRLRELEATQPALAAELRALLAADADAGGLLDEGIVPLAGDLLGGLAAGEEPAADTAAGQIVGRWRLLHCIGRGGMGEVFLAERADGEFAQRAALKRLKRGMDSEALLRRFAQERRILATLDHPHIAHLLDAGIDAQDRPYFAMEYVEGVTITEHARQHRLDVRERLRLMLEVCDAVAHAQSRLVVHRDLKPSNILVDGTGEPHLLDFGIAKILAGVDAEPPSGAATLTGTGVRVLSPAYAAPEQILGEPVSTATDVYALGVLLFELLTSVLPHRRGHHWSETLAESTQRETIERPSQSLRQLDDAQVERAYGERWRDRDRFVRELHGDLDTVVLTALRREPARRYASAAALAADLRAWLDGRPISARRDSTGYRLRKFVGRHRVGVVATAIVLLSLIGGLGAALWQARIAERHAREAERIAAKAEQTKRFVVSLFEATNPETARKGAQMSALDLLRDASKRVEAELKEASDTQAELRVTLGQSLFAVGSADEGIALAERGVEQLRVLGPDELLANGLHALAMMYEQTDRSGEAEATANEALAVLDRQPGAFALQRIVVRTTLGKQRNMRGDNAGATALYRQNLAERRELFGPDDVRLAVDWNNLGAMALLQDDIDGALAAYREALRLFDSDPDAPASRRVWLLLGLATAQLRAGDLAAAEANHRDALARAEQSLHAQHPIVAGVRRGLCETFRWQGRLDEAIATCRSSVAILAALEHPEQGISETQLGLGLLATGQDVEALAVLADAERHNGERRNREDPSYWASNAALGLAQVRNGDASGSTRLRDTLAAMETRGFQHLISYALILGQAADAAALLGQAAEADSLRSRARSQLLLRLRPDDARVVALAAAPE